MTQLRLLCRIGTERYALETTNILEIVHRVELSQGQGFPQTVTGQFNYHGQIVPVMDLSQLLCDRPSRPALGTRIILMERSDSDGYRQILGLLVENVTETLEHNQFEYASKGQHAACLRQAEQNDRRLAYTRETLLYQNEIVQCINSESLWASLNSDITSALSPTPELSTASAPPTRLNTSTTVG